MYNKYIYIYIHTSLQINIRKKKILQKQAKNMKY